MLQMYELSQPSTFRKNQQFLAKQLGVDQGIQRERSCTDVICLAIFVLLSLTFFGLFTYAMIQGNPSLVFTAYNADAKACQATAFPYGFLPNNSTFSNAVCVKTCPNINQTVPCLTQSAATGQCLNGSIKSTYKTFDLFIFCSPDPTLTSGATASQEFGFSTLGQWAYDLRNGWYILAAAVGASLMMTFIYLCLLRCCTCLLLWVSIISIILGFVAVGTILFLEGMGVQVSKSLPSFITQGNKIQLLVVGSFFWAISLLFLILVVCMYRRIRLGIAVVKAASIYLSETCQVFIMPIFTAILMTGFLAMLLIGASYLYTTSKLIVTNGQVFATIGLDSVTFILMIIYACGGLWFLFFIHGCNNYTLTSAACIWYYNHAGPTNGYLSPVCHSIRFLTCNHIGTIALSSLLFTLFFPLRLIVEIFDVRDSGQDDNCCLVCCFKCISCCLCLCNVFLRFLSEGMYVQVAVRGTAYCPSTLQSFNILSTNSMKLTLTSGISFLITLIGVLTITASVCVGAYFSQIYIPQLAQGLSDPVPVTIVASLISFVIAILFLSLIGTSSAALIQCYIMDEIAARLLGMYARFCPQELRELFEIHRDRD